MRLTRRAARQWSAWHRAGVPNVITAHEAFTLTGGRVGAPGDLWTAYPLTQVAAKATAPRGRVTR